MKKWILLFIAFALAAPIASDAQPTTNFPNGLTNVDHKAGMGSLVAPFPGKVAYFWDEFDSPKVSADEITAASKYTVRSAGTATAKVYSSAVLSATGVIVEGSQSGAYNTAEWLGSGVGVIETGSTENHYTALHANSFDLYIKDHKKLWFEARIMTGSSVIQTDLLVGLIQANDTTPMSVGDGVYFWCDDGDAYLDCIAENGGAISSQQACVTLATGAVYTMSLYWDGMGTLTGFVNDVCIGSGTLASNINKSTELAPCIGVMAGEGDPSNVLIDYIYAACER